MRYAVRSLIPVRFSDANMRVIWGVILFQTLFVLATGLTGFIPSAGFAKTIFGIVAVSFVPGFLFVATVREGVFEVEGILYAVVTSLVLMTGVGLVVNTVYLASPFSGVVSEPFQGSILIVAHTVLVGVLLVTFHQFGSEPAFPLAELRALATTQHLYFISLPLLAAVGAHYINRGETNLVMLAALALISLSPLFVLGFKRINVPVAIYLTSLATLYQNTLIRVYMTGGDGPVEYYLANLTLAHGFWDPTFATVKNGLLRLTILHPLYTHLTDLSLMLEFKIVHPLLLAFVPVVLYAVTRGMFKHHVAVLSAFLLMFLNTYFYHYARTTRNGLSLLAIGVFVLLVIDEHQNDFKILLLIGAEFLVLVSHHGAGIIFLGSLVCAYLIKWVYCRLHFVPGIEPLELDSARLSVSTALVAICGALFYLWYSYSASGKLFNFLTIAFFRDVIFGISGFFSSQSVTVQQISQELESFTYRFIRLEYITISIGAGLGISAIGLWRMFPERMPDVFRNERLQPVHADFAALSIAAVAVLVFAFAPTGSIGVGRIFMQVSLFIVPFGVLAAAAVIRFGTGVDGTRVGYVLGVVVLVFFLVNSGFVSATVTHDRTPQPNIDRERILAEGASWQMYHLYHRYTPEKDQVASRWAVRNLDLERPFVMSSAHQTIRSGFFYTGYSGAQNTPGIDYRYFGETQPSSPHYYYLSSYNERIGAVFPTADGGSYPVRPRLEYSETGLADACRIYSTTGAALYRTC